MRKAAILVATILLIPLATRAQKSEAFTGYSFQVMEARLDSFAVINGWDISYTYKVSDFLGISTNASGNYGTVLRSRMNFHSYLVGPQVQFPLPRNLSPFAHARLGWSRESFQNIITSHFSFNLGGGIDYRASKSFSVRLIEADFITGNFTQSSPESRFSTGIVFRF